MSRCVQANYNSTRSIMKLMSALSPLIIMLHLLHGSVQGAVIPDRGNTQQKVCTCSQQTNSLTSDIMTVMGQSVIPTTSARSASIINEKEGYGDSDADFVDSSGDYFNGDGDDSSSEQTEISSVKNNKDNNGGKYLISGKDKDSLMKDIIRQVILIKPPEQIYNHEIRIQEQGARKQPKIVIYVLPRKVIHTYNITDHRMHGSFNKTEPKVYYLSREHFQGEDQWSPEVEHNKISEIVTKSNQEPEDGSELESQPKEEDIVQENLALDNNYDGEIEERDTVEDSNISGGYGSSVDQRNELRGEDVVPADPYLDSQTSLGRVPDVDQEHLEPLGYADLHRDSQSSLGGVADQGYLKPLGYADPHRDSQSSLERVPDQEHLEPLGYADLHRDSQSSLGRVPDQEHLKPLGYADPHQDSQSSLERVPDQEHLEPLGYADLHRDSQSSLERVPDQDHLEPMGYADPHQDSQSSLGRVPDQEHLDSGTQASSTHASSIGINHRQYINNFNSQSFQIFESDVNGENDFEIIPAILKSYFYIGPGDSL